MHVLLVGVRFQVMSSTQSDDSKSQSVVLLGAWRFLPIQTQAHTLSLEARDSTTRGVPLNITACETRKYDSLDNLISALSVEPDGKEWRTGRPLTVETG